MYIREATPYSTTEYMDDGLSIDFSNDQRSSLHEKAKVAIMFSHWYTRQRGIDVYTVYHDIMAQGLNAPETRGMGKLRVTPEGRLELCTTTEWAESLSKPGHFYDAWGAKYRALANGETLAPGKLRWYLKD